MPSTHDHIVKSYDSELKRLDGEIQRMGEIATAQLDAAVVGGAGILRQPQPVRRIEEGEDVVREPHRIGGCLEGHFAAEEGPYAGLEAAVRAEFCKAILHLLAAHVAIAAGAAELTDEQEFAPQRGWPVVAE